MDDLTTIKGVGPAIAKQLESAGITTFEQLKAVDPQNPPFVLTGRVGWPYLVGEVQHVVSREVDDGSAGSEGVLDGDPGTREVDGDGGGAPGAQPRAGDHADPADGREVPGDGQGADPGHGQEGDASARAGGDEAAQEEAAPAQGAAQTDTPEEGVKPGPFAHYYFVPTTITVTGPKRGRWRAGRHFGKEPTIIAVDELSDDQIRAIQNDPALTYEVE